VGSSAVGDVGQIEQVGFSLFAYDALGAARTAVFFAGVWLEPAHPPVQVHLESSRVIAPVGELLLHPAIGVPLPELDPLLLLLLLVLPVLPLLPVLLLLLLLLPEPDPLLLAALPLLPPELDPLVVVPMLPPELLLVPELPLPREPLELAPPSSGAVVGNAPPEEHATKAKRHPTPAERDKFVRLIGTSTLSGARAASPPVR
jgi:hypothetical protein